MKVLMKTFALSRKNAIHAESEGGNEVTKACIKFKSRVTVNDLELSVNFGKTR